MNEDRIYSTDQDGDEPFRFNKAVADVFPDMLQRSIPGYAASIEAIGSLAARYVTEGSTCYDLGCSLGAASIAMRQGIRVPDCRIIAVDNAPAMLKRCAKIVAAEEQRSQTKIETPTEIMLADIDDTDILNASMVVMNYTLQFLDVDKRQAIISRIFDGLLTGGLLLLSEKVIDEDPFMEDLLIDLHHEHKRRNDYSQLEVGRKRAALENVLNPDTVTAHRQRLMSAGFAHTAVWLRYFNFVSIVAIK